MQRSLARGSGSRAVESHEKSDDCEGGDDVDEPHGLEGTRIEVVFVGFTELLPSIQDERDGDQEQDEGAADSACVRDHNLWVALEHHNNNHGDSEDDGPDTLDKTAVVFEKNLAAACIADPALHRHDLHEVVSEGDSEDGHGRDIQHWVELADLAKHWNVHEVFVEELSDLAREYGFLPFRWCARIIKAAKSEVCKKAFGKEQYRCNNISSNKHLSNASLGSDRVYNAWN